VPTESATLADLDQLVRLVRQICDWKSLNFKTRHRGDRAQHGHQTELSPHPIDPFRSGSSVTPSRPARMQDRESSAVFPLTGQSIRSASGGVLQLPHERCRFTQMFAVSITVPHRSASTAMRASGRLRRSTR
jgi:hypothetical protein